MVKQPPTVKELLSHNQFGAIDYDDEGYPDYIRVYYDIKGCGVSAYMTGIYHRILDNTYWQLTMFSVDDYFITQVNPTTKTIITYTEVKNE